LQGLILLFGIFLCLAYFGHLMMKHTPYGSFGLRLCLCVGTWMALPTASATTSHMATSTEVSPYHAPNTRQLIDARIAALSLQLHVPAPAGNYLPFKRAGSLVFINQVALHEGRILHPGTIGQQVSEQEARQATRITMGNVLAVLQQATEGDLSRVKQAVQLTAYFNTVSGYTQHASLMNEASDMLVAVLGDAGRHTRATVGAVSLPLGSAVEIQAIFELYE
jgi:NAD(P)H dehydrogenase (quinone)